MKTIYVSKQQFRRTIYIHIEQASIHRLGHAGFRIDFLPADSLEHGASHFLFVRSYRVLPPYPN
ncbi:hypothetical protein ACTQ33_16110 [Candidatus Avoscillospira sp. LCP25S3_F1]|uniref:hypothetical protein n=1 Tax=Candidatus Avoscillospira sp. LCP25S3_F1 TaxID=3438825 RepID=UPI003F8E3A96